MFDVGFSELVVIGVVALIVIGPERLPAVARTAGVLLSRLQRYVNSVKADINREIQLDELKKLQEQMTQQASEIKSSVSAEMQAVEASLQELEAPFAPTSGAGAAPAAVALEAPLAPVATEVPLAPVAAEASAEAQVQQQLDLGLGASENKSDKA